MAAIDELIQQIADPVLRERIRAEVEDLSKQKKFGLVFENHLPEHTPLYEMPIKVGSLVMPKLKKGDELFTVKAINGDNAIVVNKATGEESELPLRSLVVAAELGEPIYPYLKYVDSISRAPNDDLWHVLIEADNYHALQLLEYLYAGKVDCIYIDPPYNTGAKDWKYNNDYVDGNDSYRHSKWLSMMEKRLKIARRLLSPNDSVLIVTIDEKEYLNLGCLLRDIFPNARIQMVSCVINHGGVARGNEFSRSDEYIFFVMIGSAAPSPLPLGTEWLGNVTNTTKTKLRWREFRRSGSHSTRKERPGLFYPIFVREDGRSIHSLGDTYYGNDIQEILPPPGTRAIWPLYPDGEEGCWVYQQSSLKKLIEKGYIKLGKFTKNGMSISYIAKGEQEKVESGEIPVIGRDTDGSIITDDGSYIPKYIPGTNWSIKAHNASEYGTKILKQFIGSGKFDFPKSLYSTLDAIRFFVANKKNALILDFFAGSGTTLHSVNYLNSQDGGRRRCILVTNNEVSESEAKSLLKAGSLPGDEEWEKCGIARSVTWPRTVNSISGRGPDGKPASGQYLNGSSLSEGFKANAAFFQLSFLNKDDVTLGNQFRELIPLIWLKSGGHHSCPFIPGCEIVPGTLILPKNRLAVLIDESSFDQFEREINNRPEIESVFIVTNSDIGYREMSLAFEGKQTYQLYRDYLDNFRLNVRK